MTAIPDLPPRTWRGWWLERPKWLRIGVWAMLALGLTHAVVAIRIAIGWIEDPTIQQLRANGHHIRYSWREQRERFFGEWLLLDGLMGRSARHVHSIVYAQRADDLLYCIENLPNLEELLLTDLKLSYDQLASLRKCRKLQSLNLSNSSIQDQDIELIGQVPTLTWICLEGTEITDAAIPFLNRLPKLKEVLVSHTALTQEALLAWRDSSAGGRLTIDSEKISYPDDLSATVRFSDGRYTSNFSGAATLTIEGPLSSEKPLVVSSNANCWFWFDILHWSSSSIALYSDGDYRYSLKLGDYDAEPVIIHIENGKPSVNHFVFQMPVTRKQALGESP